MQTSIVMKGVAVPICWTLAGFWGRWLHCFLAVWLGRLVGLCLAATTLACIHCHLLFAYKFDLPTSHQLQPSKACLWMPAQALSGVARHAKNWEHAENWERNDRRVTIAHTSKKNAPNSSSFRCAQLSVSELICNSFTVLHWHLWPWPL